MNWIFRHGQTDNSVRHLVNGDPDRAIDLNQAGREACRRAASLRGLQDARTWVTSEFPRARQTCRLLRTSSTAERSVEAGLNELDYGVFEGQPFLTYGAWLQLHGPAERPDGAAESQQEGIARMLTALREVLKRPGDRVIIGHGLLISILIWGLNSPRSGPVPLFLPEAPYVDPLVLSDEEMTDVTTKLLGQIAQSGATRSTATFDSTCPLLETKDSRNA